MKEFNNLPYARNIFGIDDMAAATLGTGIISGVASLFGGKSSSDANLQAQRETNEMQLKMFQQQLDYNRAAEDRARSYALQDFQMENKYNSPAAQRARYEAAGLNPALMMQGGTPSAQMESTSGAVAPSAPQLGAPVQQDYITPAMQQMVNGMIGFSQAQKNAEEAAGIASDTRVKAATEQLRIKQAFQENQKRIYELRSMKYLPKIKEMELKNLQEQNSILQDTNAMLDTTFDARSKAQSTANYVQDRLAAKYNEEMLAQKIINRFAVEREKRNLKIQDAQVRSLVASAVQAMTQAGVNREMAAYVACQKYGIDPKSEAGKNYYRALEIALEESEFDSEFYNNPFGKFLMRLGQPAKHIVPSFSPLK